MKRSHSAQYTIRGVPERVDSALRQRARRFGKSLNQTALEALSEGAGMSASQERYEDLDFLAGSWVADAETDRVLEEQRQVDADLWL